MFWGLNLKANRKYTQTTTKSFHISQAALEADASEGAGANQIFITYENQKFLICTLRKEKCEQVMLDLNFTEGDEIGFQSIGSGNVSLSGYLIHDAENFMNGDEDDDSDIEMSDLRDTLNQKGKANKAKNNLKNAALAAALAGQGEDDEDEDEDEDDSDFNGDIAEENDEEDSDEDDDDEEEDDDEDETEDEEDAEDEEIVQPKAKQPKLEKVQKKENGVAKGAPQATPPEKGKKDKKKEKKQAQPQQELQQQKSGGERSLSGGVKVEDVRVGNGPEIKSGKRALVYYEGRLKNNNKVFDSHKQGAPFKFGVGRGEVIKGWDVGVVGMKVGGKRRVTCPPHMAYGARGSPPSIPPNSTLVFEIELKGVN